VIGDLNAYEAVMAILAGDDTIIGGADQTPFSAAPAMISSANGTPAT